MIVSHAGREVQSVPNVEQVHGSPKIKAYEFNDALAIFHNL